MKIYQTIFILFSILFFSACTDVIDVDLEEGTDQLVVDAWINNKPETQTIRLRMTSPYFDSAPSPAVLGATVEVTDDNGNIFSFVDTKSEGNYSWEPAPGASFGEIGQNYTLRITVNGQEYSSVASMNRIVPIDSLTQKFEEAELGDPEGIYTEFFARDPLGLGDCYWIKTFKNGQFLNKPGEINIAYDAGFSAGSEVDGLIFIPPIREATNRLPDTGDDAVDNSDVAPWAPGDSMYVELHSISVAAFDFLEQARTQMTLGDAGIFAEPLSNVPTNIVSPASGDALGFFCVSAVTSLGRKIE